MSNSSKQQFFDLKEDDATHGGVVSRIMAIDKDIASMFLKQSTYNRKISSKRVAQYVQDMRNGKWVPGQATIDFDVNGRLVNGHHVLTSIVECGMPEVCNVRTGLMENSIEHFDQAISMRSISDTAAFLMEGGQMERAREYALIARKIIQYNDRTASPDYNARVRFVIEHYDQLINVVYKLGSYKSMFLKARHDFYAAGYFICQKNTFDAWHEFVDAMLNTTLPNKNAPTNFLCRYLMKQEKHRGFRVEVMCAVVQCWNAWVQGKQVGRVHGLNCEYMQEILVKES